MPMKRGSHHSAEARTKMSAAQQGKPGHPGNVGKAPERYAIVPTPEETAAILSEPECHCTPCTVLHEAMRRDADAIAAREAARRAVQQAARAVDEVHELASTYGDHKWRDVREKEGE
jgi:hypothetical protein